MAQGVAISGEDVTKTLGAANERAKHHAASLLDKPEHRVWREHIAVLSGSAFPRTYLAILAVTLTARSMHDADTLDVRHIKASTSKQGYSAPSIGSKVAAFAKEQRIDLRANSQQPLNNQPFTYKDYIQEDMGVQGKYVDQWKVFWRIVLDVQSLTPGQAQDVLALLFHLRRRVDAPTIAVSVRKGGKSTMDKVSASLAQFVTDHVDGGRVGQAFVAALLDLLYTPDEVLLGDAQDPDVSTPGDVHVGVESAEIWLWAEAKQRVITTGDVTGFLSAVQKAGGERVVYFALVNSGYSNSVRMEMVQKEADRVGMGVQVIESPSAALDWILPLAPGSYAHVSSALLERMHARMTQAGCTPDNLVTLGDLAKTYADVT